MKDKSKIVVIVTSLIFTIFLLLIIVSLIINNLNKVKKEEDLYLCIYQYNVIDYHFDTNNEPLLYGMYKFTPNLHEELVITSLDGKHYNKVVIDNGVCLVSDSNCSNKICQHSRITNEISLVNNLTISCMPSGLFVCVKTQNEIK